MWKPDPIDVPLLDHVEQVLSGDYPNAQARLLANLIEALNPTDEELAAIFSYTSTSTVHGWAQTA